MTIPVAPLPPQPGIGRVNQNGTPTQAQIDYERKFAAWVATVANSISTGIPFPSPTTLGGVKSATASTHQFQRGIDTGGNPLFAQPAAGDISGLGPFATASSIAVGSITGLGALATLSSVDLASQATGNLGVSHFNSGIDANSSHFWRGDGTWASFSVTPGGSSGQVQFNNAGSFGGFTVAGDGTLDPVTGNLLVTKTSGVAFAAVATSGSASDLGSGTLPNARLSAVPNSALANSTISGVALGSNLFALTIGAHLTGTSYNGSAGVTIATDATNANTASTIVARDGSGNFSAGTITASLTGAASLNLLKSNNLSDLASALTARSSTGLNVESGTGHGNSDYTILATDRWVYTNAAFTAPRTWTLPAASSVNAGGSIIVDDLQNTLTATNTLTIARAGSDLINGLSTFVLKVAGCRVRLISDGISKWSATLTFLGATGTGSAVLSDSPTFTGTITAASANFSGTVTGLNSQFTSASGSFSNLSNTTNASQLHLSGTGNDEGAYFLGLGTNTAIMAGGVSYDGTHYTAKATTASFLGVSAGFFVFYSDSGLTVGATYTPTGRLIIDATGAITNGVYAASIIGAPYGGTGQGAYILGDTLYSSAANTLARLAGNTTSTKKYLSQTGTGTVSAAPAWAALSGDGAWTQITPTLNNWTPPTTFTFTASWKQLFDKTYALRIVINITTLGPASGLVFFTFPNSATPKDDTPLTVSTTIGESPALWAAALASGVIEIQPLTAWAARKYIISGIVEVA